MPRIGSWAVESHPGWIMLTCSGDLHDDGRHRRAAFRRRTGWRPSRPRSATPSVTARAAETSAILYYLPYQHRGHILWTAVIYPLIGTLEISFQHLKNKEPFTDPFTRRAAPPVECSAGSRHRPRQNRPAPKYPTRATPVIRHPTRRTRGIPVADGHGTGGPAITRSRDHRGLTTGGRAIPTSSTGAKGGRTPEVDSLGGQAGGGACGDSGEIDHSFRG